MNWSEYVLFARTFLRHPKNLGSLIPSSRYLADKLMQQIDWRRARVIVEFGPGIGNLTQEIARRMNDRATLVAIESNPDFAAYLRKKFESQPNVRIHRGSAEEIREVLQQYGLDAADYVVSGIPFTALPPETAQLILSETTDALSQNGRMLVYQFTNSVLPHLHAFFHHVEIGHELRNILPARTFHCFGVKSSRLPDEASAA